jgi:hypothetical protein
MLFFLILSLFTILKISHGLNLIPDPIAPFTINRPTFILTEPSEMIIRFSFPQGEEEKEDRKVESKKSNGLNYKQFIGLVFPPTNGDIDLNSDLSIKHSCKLVDITNNIIITTTAVLSTPSLLMPSVLADNNILYCRIDDLSSNVPLKPGISYALSISLSTVKVVSTNFIRGLSLITTSSNNPEGIIIDSLPVLGTMAQYGNYYTYSTKPIVISSASVEVNSVSSLNTINPYSTFDLTITLTCSSYVNSLDTILSFRYPTDLVLPPTGVILNSINDSINSSLTLSVKPFGSDSIMINGLDDYYPKEVISLTLRGWKALDSNTNVTKNLELILLYTNTNTVLSYSSFSVFTVARTVVNLSVNHPEYWDIYRNGAWPLKFTFSLSSTLNNGGWVLIQHSNALNDGVLGNKLSFIASTCDFSQTDSNLLGTRSYCYPLRLDFNYPNASSTVAYKGSGVFFYIPGTLPAGKIYTVTIWAFADNCGGTSLDPINTNSFVIPNFIVQIYKSIDPSKLNENRFTTAQGIIAESISTPFNGKCWNNRMQSPTAISPYNYDSTLLSSIKLDGSDSSSTKPGITLYLEIFDWQIQSQVSTSCTNCWALNMANNFGTEKFIYSNSSGDGIDNTISSGSYFLVRFQLRRSSTPGNDMLYNHIPTPFTNAAVNVNSNNNLLPGRLILQLSSAWFDAGDSYKGSSASCYFSWGAFDATGFIDSQKQLLYSNTQTAGQGASSNSNFFAANVSSTGSQIDTTYSLLPPDSKLSNPSSSSITRLVSTFNPGTIINKNINWKYMTDFNKNGSNSSTTPIQIGFFSSCVKWILKPPVITSPYTYIDIQIQWMYQRSQQDKSLGIPINNLRLIKLFPEGGVINDFTKILPKTFSTVNPYTNHVVYTSSSTNSAVCLIELDYSALITDTVSNSFYLFFMFGMLIESDYNDISANYPIGNLGAGVNVYGLQSAYSMSTDNFYISTVNSGYQTLPDIIKEINAQTPYSAANSVLPFGSNKSSYLFYMGSILRFSNISTSNMTNNNSNLLIPYYCPFFYAGSQSIGVMPTLIGSWLTMNSNGVSFSSMDRVLTYQHLQGSLSQNYSVLLSKSPVKGNGSTLVQATSYIATLRFDPYTTANNKNLYVYNGGILGGGNPNLTCTGHSLFLSSNIPSDNVLTPNLGYTPSYGYFFRSNFYVFGKLFNKAYFFGQNSQNTSSPSLNMVSLSPINNLKSNTYFTGIIRPSLSNFLNSNNVFVTTDKIGYFCVSSGVTDYHYLSNYIAAISSFTLDFNPDNSSLQSISIGLDKAENFKSDPAGNIRMSVTLPADITLNSQIKFTSSSFNSNTRCAVLTSVNKELISPECVTGTLNDITCNLPYSGLKYDICCYNILLTNTFTINSLSTVFPVNTSISNLSSYMSSNIYTNVQIVSNLISSQLPNFKDISTIDTSSKISLSYSHSNTEGSFGVAKFIIQLPREATYNMKILIQGDLSSMYILGSNPRCMASFSNTFEINSGWDNGDLLIDSCSVNDLISGGNYPIEISMKNSVYKCGISFNKVLYVKIWPVVLVNWNNPSMININNFLIKLETFQGDSLALNTKSSQIELPKNMDSTYPLLTSQWEYLCFISSISPRVPSEMADYQFEIDLDVNKFTLASATINELTIFWPYQYYGSNLANIVCTYSGTNVPCSFSDENILNVKFPTFLPIGSTKKIIVIVSGVINPAVDSDLKFPCNLNYFDNLLMSRSTIVTGSGRMIGGITTNSITANGNLIFMQPVIPISDNGSRNISVHTFRIGVDYAIGITASSITILGSPIMNIIFPKEYNLSLFSSKPTVKIYEYTIGVTGTVKGTALTGAATLTGNKLAITIPKVNFVLNPSTFRYWEFEVSNVSNPDNKNEGFMFTSPFYAFLINSLGTQLLRTYTNLNTFNPASYQFQFKSLQWIIDVYTEGNVLNSLSIRPGRFNTAYFTIRKNNVALPSTTTITLTDTIFKMEKTSYLISSSFNKPFIFQIGCSCTVPSGTYYINFTSSDKINFSGMIPISVYVKGIYKYKIKVSDPQPSIMINSAAWIYTIPEVPNFDPLSINWVPDAGNDPNVSLTNFTLTQNQLYNQYSTFSSNTTTISDMKNQIFSVNDPNQCFTMENKILNVTMIKSSPPNLSMYDFNSSFYYYNSDSNKNLTDKSSVGFSFYPPSSPLFIYCALKCSGNNFPDETPILTSNQALNTNLLQYYSNYIKDSNSIDIVFSNLIRGLYYDLKCIIQSTQIVLEQRSRVEIYFQGGVYYNIGGAILNSSFITNSTLLNYTVLNINNTSNLNETSTEIIGNTTTINNTSLLNSTEVLNNFTNTTNSTLLNITSSNPQINNNNIYVYPSPPFASQCVSMKFSSFIDLPIKTALINYCQKLFSHQGFFQDGCIICTSSYSNYTVAGLTLPSNYYCGNSRMLNYTRTSLPNINFSINNISSATLTYKDESLLSAVYNYSICMVQDPTCKTNMDFNRNFDYVINLFMEHTSTLELIFKYLNLLNVPVYVPSQINVNYSSINSSYLSNYQTSNTILLEQIIQFNFISKFLMYIALPFLFL